MEEGKSKEDLNLFYDNANKKKMTTKKKKQNMSLKPQNTTRIKARKSLMNISYNGITEEDVSNKNFVFDIYVLLTKNLDPFSIEHKR